MKKITSVLLALCLIVALAAQIAPTWALAEDAPDEPIAELYEGIGVSPDGWYYDYPNRKLDTEFLPSTVPLLLKFNFQDDAPPVDPEPEGPADPDPVDPTPTDPEETEKPDPDDTPSPKPPQPSYNGGNDDGYVLTPSPLRNSPHSPALLAVMPSLTLQG